MSQTVQRAIVIIEALAEQPRTLSEVAQLLGVHRSTALRLLQTLESSGFARQRTDGRYAVGTHLISIAQQTLDSLDLRELSTPHLRALHAKCGHTIHLAQLIDDQVIYVDKVDGTEGVRMYSRIGRPASLHASGVGKAILSQMPREHREQLLQNTELSHYTAATFSTQEGLRDELERINQRGWAADDGEFEDFINCVAAPVSNSTGDIIAAISIAAVKVIAPPSQLRRLVPDLQEQAKNLSRELG